MHAVVSMISALALMISTTIAGVPGSVSAADSTQVPTARWPHTIATNEAAIEVYPPQAVAWNEHRNLEARVAVGVIKKGMQKPVLGTLEVSADTQTDCDTRTVIVSNRQVRSSRFPSLDTEQAAGMEQLVRRAMAGDTTIKERLLKGDTIDGKPFKVHLDGYNQLDYLLGKTTKGARTDFAYFNDDGVLVAYRHENWKAVFCEMRKPGGFAVWYEPFTCLRIPKLFNLCMDPFERADIVSDQYDDWRITNAYLHGWLTMHAAAFLETFVEYPPSQPPASFTIDQIQENVERRIQEKAKQEGTQ
jgi:hypothetical protein